MSRATREHIRKLEAHIRDAASELDRVTAHEFVAERGHNNCQCGLCRAKRSLAACPFRDRGVRRSEVVALYEIKEVGGTTERNGA